MIIPQTHFIGVLVPEDLTKVLVHCREWMQERYGSRSGYGTPVHITLIPPFFPGAENSGSSVSAAAEQAASEWKTGGRICTCTVDGFGSFSERTVYARVAPSPDWTVLRNMVYKYLSQQCPETVRKDTRPFIPHLTVANRDIPPGACAEALEHFAGLSLSAVFPADNITVFVRTDRHWEPDYTVHI